MPQLTRANEKEINDLFIRNAVLSTAIGLGTGTGLNYLGNRFLPKYRRLPFGIKLSLLGALTIGYSLIVTEKAGIEYQRQLRGVDPDIEHRPSLIIAKEGGLIDRSIDFVTEHRWSLLGATWATGITGSIIHMYRQKGLTWTQRVVQARMYAQALTILGVLGTAAVASLSSTAHDARLAPRSESYELRRLLQDAEDSHSSSRSKGGEDTEVTPASTTTTSQ